MLSCNVCSLKALTLGLSRSPPIPKPRQTSLLAPERFKAMPPARGETGFEAKFTKYCGDPDTFFAYTAQKQIMIKDRRLGILNYSFMLLIAIYIFVCQLLLGQGYLHFWDADNTVRLALKEPVKNGCNPLEDGCRTDFNAMSQPGTNPWTLETGKQYCCAKGCNMTSADSTECQCPGRELLSNNCTYLDGLSAAEVNGRSIAVTTRRVIWSQDRNPHCYLGDSDSGAELCEGGVWDTTKHGRTYFIKDIEDFVLQIDHTLSWETDTFSKLISATTIPKAYIEIGTGREEEDNIRNSDVCKKLGKKGKAVTVGNFDYVPATKAPCLVLIPDVQSMLLNSTSLLDEIPVWVALLAAGLEFEDTFVVEGKSHSHRYAGAVVSITIDYSNVHPLPWWGLWTIEPFYIYRFKAMKGSMFTRTEMKESFNQSNRIVQDLGAVSFEVHPGGTLATFSLAYMMVQFTTSLALTAMATIIVNMLAQYALRHSTFYNKALTEETTDFSNVDVLLELKSDKELYDMLEQGKISTYGLNYNELKDEIRKERVPAEKEKLEAQLSELKNTMILRLVNAGWVATKEEEEQAYRRIDERNRKESTSCFGLFGGATKQATQIAAASSTSHPSASASELRQVATEERKGLLEK